MNQTHVTTPVKIDANDMVVRGILAVPPNAKSIILFAHGSDSSNRNPRNRLVARALFHQGLAVLLPDLTGETEDSDDFYALDEQDYVDQTAERLIDIIDWIDTNPATRGMHIGLFGGRCGAAAAMIAAARRPHHVHAVVSRGGSLEFAGKALAKVNAPTLLIVGSNDPARIEQTRKASKKMPGNPMVEVVHGASEFFSEPGKLEHVASVSFMWFQRNLVMSV